jgi:hypothetical protein
MQCRVYPFLYFHLPLFVLAAPLGGAATAEGQGAVELFNMDGSSCGFVRVRSRLTKFIKGAKKAAYCPKTRFSPQSIEADRPGAWFPGILGPYRPWFSGIGLSRVFERVKVP